jgi:hypothetical protein
VCVHPLPRLLCGMTMLCLCNALLLAADPCASNRANKDREIQLKNEMTQPHMALLRGAGGKGTQSLALGNHEWGQHRPRARTLPGFPGRRNATSVSSPCSDKGSTCTSFASLTGTATKRNRSLAASSERCRCCRLHGLPNPRRATDGSKELLRPPCIRVGHVWELRRLQKNMEQVPAKQLLFPEALARARHFLPTRVVTHGDECMLRLWGHPPNNALTPPVTVFV